MYRARNLMSLLVPVLFAMQFAGCSTAPKTESDRATLLDHAKRQTSWFTSNVTGLDDQIAGSAGYVIFPDVLQYGTLIGGGVHGRGVLYGPDGNQMGWSLLNVASAGLQVGVEGLSMLMVLENESTLQQFKADKLTGSVQGVAVADDSAVDSKASFTDGVAVYQGANKGLMAGVNVGLEHIKYEPLSAH